MSNLATQPPGLEPQGPAASVRSVHFGIATFSSVFTWNRRKLE
jgi:hypothetical protein